MVKDTEPGTSLAEETFWFFLRGRRGARRQLDKGGRREPNTGGAIKSTPPPRTSSQRVSFFLPFKKKFRWHTEDLCTMQGGKIREEKRRADYPQLCMDMHF